MWKTVHLFSHKLQNSKILCRPYFMRKYLTSAFNCDEAWNKRLESPYIKKIKVSKMFYELENQFQHFGKANGIDIDLFVNAVTDDSHIDEIEDVIHKLRLSPAATSLLPSTQHAFIRMIVSFGNMDQLIRVLDDRMNYGIFMDDYSCILLMNKFLKEQNIKNAARIGTINMLQEDFSHPIVKFMSLFACHKYLLNPVPWEQDQPEPEKSNDDDDDEVKKVRVRYLRNPYFDDHFDLKNPFHLIGKTFWLIGNLMPDTYGRSYSLIGYTLHEKWDQVKLLINMLLQSKDKPLVFKDSVTIVRKFINDLSVEKDDGNKFAEHKVEIDNLLSQLEQLNLFSDDDLLKITEEKMKDSIKECEPLTIEDQIKTYEDWEKQRRDLVNEHIEQLKREKILGEIEATKHEIKEKEKELFFFENEDKLDMMIDNKRVRYPKKWLGKKKQKRVTDAEYIPPEIEKRREN